jgi:vacuolar protein-sorting-associated protein 4
MDKDEFILLFCFSGVGNDNAGILILAATNRPWSLDMAMRRRYDFVF